MDRTFSKVRFILKLTYSTKILKYYCKMGKCMLKLLCISIRKYIKWRKYYENYEKDNLGSAVCADDKQRFTVGYICGV